MRRVGIYSNDSLILSELVERVSRDYPTIFLTIYTDKGYLDSMDNIDNVRITSIDDNIEDDSLVVLNDATKLGEKIKDFNGKIIDFSQTVQGSKNVVYIEEPILYCFENLLDKTPDFAIIGLPAAVFGKAAVDDLLNQTRDIFSFVRNEYKVFDRMLAFNMFFVKRGDQLYKNYFDLLEENLDFSFELRQLPVSTAFIIDIFGDISFEEDEFFVNKQVYSLHDALEEEKVVVMKNGVKTTLVGDYLKIIIKQIIDEL